MRNRLRLSSCLTFLGGAILAMAQAPQTGRSTAPASTAPQGQMLDANRPYLGNIQWGSPYAEITQRSGSVYLGTVERVTQTIANPGLIAGNVAIHVTATLRGPKADTLSLPFSYPDPERPTRQSAPQIWPILENLPQGSLLIITVGSRSDNSDPTNLEPPAILAATNVRPVAGEDDPLIRDYRAIVKLADVAPEELPAALMKAANDSPNIAMCYYLFDAARSQLKPAEALDVICAMLSSFDRPDAPRTYPLRALDYLTSTWLAKRTATDSDRAKVLMTLGKMVRSGSHMVSADAVGILAQAIRPFPNGPGSMLNDQQIHELEMLVSTFKPDPRGGPNQMDIPNAVLEWLHKKQPATAVAPNRATGASAPEATRPAIR